MNFSLIGFGVLLAIAGIHGVPGDFIFKCSGSCSQDSATVARLVVWDTMETPEDVCSTNCVLKGLKLIQGNGDIDTVSLGKYFDGSGVDYSGIGRNINDPGFQAKFNNFVQKNRNTLAKLFNHLEAIKN